MWSLTNSEHSCTGVCQMVPNHSVFPELYSDCGILIPAVFPNPNIEMDTLGFLPSPEAIAESLEWAYTHQDEVKVLGEKARQKFTSPEYLWENISKTWDTVFERVLGQ